MTGKIYSSLFLSVLFHGVFIFVLMFSVKNSMVDTKEMTYVTLIQESINTSITYTSEKESKVIEKDTQTKQKDLSENSLEKTRKTTKEDEQRWKERVDALRAKKKVLEQAQFGSIEYKTKNNSIKVVSPTYLALISGLIRYHWNIPETVPKNLEAVISVRILPDGQIIIEGFEKSSGNTLFDSSVIKAIKNSSPLPPPKDEVVVGLRFKP
ncbi:MAG: energy transducer TonB [Thermodesulfovibrio sp.]